MFQKAHGIVELDYPPENFETQTETGSLLPVNVPRVTREHGSQLIGLKTCATL